MNSDDPRHGSVAGASAHRYRREPMCDACRAAYRKYQQEYRPSRAGSKRPPPPAPEPVGLTDGRWMPSRGGVQRWEAYA